MQQLSRNGSRSQRRSERPVLQPELGSERPVLHRELVRREALLDWFSVHRAEAVVAIFAPAGYGKTTLLGQAAEADERPVGWVSLHDRDNDPLELMSHLASALDQLAGAGPAILDRPQGWPSESWSSAIPRLAAAFASRERSAVLVLDDVHVLENRHCLEIVRALGAAIPHGSQLVVAGRAEPQLGLPRLRAERRVAELGRHDLAFDPIEAGALLSAAGLDLAGGDVAELTRRTEGWATGLYLTALSLRETHRAA